jgi:hypothetical protein
MLARVRYLLDGRLFEWSFTVATLWFAVEILRHPESIANGAFVRLTDVMEPETLSAYSMVVGLCGAAALLTNGYSTVGGPIVRGICAIGRAYLWSQISFALYVHSDPSAGWGFWAVFACAELYGAYRAMNDVQRAL